MARCSSCSAPLPANSNRCRYCGIRNDVDLHGKHAYSLHAQQSDRLCPACGDPLQTIDLKLNGTFLIERCAQCFGLFFDPGEIEILLDSSVSNVFAVNTQWLRNINKERYQNKQVKYVKCPVCRVLMNRVNFGHRSGVIIDQCKKHGVWLESGEITHLMEWKKAGGQIIHAKKENIPKKRPAKQSALPETSALTATYSEGYQYPDLLESIAFMVFKLFK